MTLKKNILIACALVVTALLLFFACSRNEGEIYTTESEPPTPTAPAGNRSFSTRVIPSGDSVCPFGGVAFDTCVDIDSNGVCTEAHDRDYSSQNICNSFYTYVCSSTEPAGTNCSAGGLKMQAFTDIDGDRICDSNEPTIGTPSYVCNSPVSLSVINEAADGVIDDSDAAINADVIENPFEVFDEEAYAIVPASTSSCSAVASGSFSIYSIPKAGDDGFVLGSSYKICARYTIGSEIELLLSSAFQRIH